MALTTATGLLSLLEEPDDSLRKHALELLDASVDQFWPEVSGSLSKIASLHDRKDFKERELAALLASKVYYHLEALDDALAYALSAGARFDVTEESEYVESILAKCIDDYTRLRVQQYEGKGKEKEEAVSIEARLVDIMERMFERCLADGQYIQCLGIALETRRLDVVERAIRAGDSRELLSYCLSQAQRSLSSRTFRQEVLSKLVALYSGLETPDYLSICQCWLFLDQPKDVADTLDALLKKSRDEALMAYQVALDLAENQNQPFLNRVMSFLPALAPASASAAVSASGDAAAAPGASGAPSASASASQAAAPAADDDSYETRMSRLRDILSGDASTQLNLQFLFTKNKTDLRILQNIKDKLEPRNSVTHNATVVAHALMHAGTTVDTFLRDNLEWLSKAQNWAKFTATASIGVIHKGHHKESLKLLQPYLPQQGASGSPYQEGGALYAMGLIHANHGGERTDFLLEALRNSGQNEIVQHGACLGLGLSAMATNNPVVFEELKTVVFSENAVAGEAAALALGLVMLGSGTSQALEELVAYAHDTQHEKIIRGIALGVAMFVYGREEQADALIEQLMADKDALLRYGGVWSVAMAYVGTSNNGAIRRLLHVAVSDVSDDVRRAAVTALGFVLANQPDQVPRLVSLLAESYNLHVRYGACLAVGIACAGSGNKEAVSLLEPLCKDRVDLVRQGAMIALSMVLMQHNDAKEPRVKTLRKTLTDALTAKGDTMTKLGAILAQGILDAGGRNVNISLVSPNGHKKMAAIVGMAVFPQFWYWYPYMHFLSLALSPTALIGLNHELKLPRQFSCRSEARPSLFAYPAPVELKKTEEKKKVKTATLSVTAKAQQRAKKKEAASGVDKDGDAAMTTPADAAAAAAAAPAPAPAQGEEAKEEKKDEAKDKEQKEEKKQAEPEPEFEILENPARVTWAQQAFLKADPKQRYVPVKEKLAGMVMLRDTRPDEPEEFVVDKAPKVGVPGISDDEPEPPQPFQFTRQ